MVPVLLRPARPWCVTVNRAPALRTHLWPGEPWGAASCPSQASVSALRAWLHGWEHEALRRICCCDSFPAVYLHQAAPAPQPSAPSAPLPSPVPAAKGTETMRILPAGVLIKHIHPIAPEPPPPLQGPPGPGPSTRHLLRGEPPAAALGPAPGESTKAAPRCDLVSLGGICFSSMALHLLSVLLGVRVPEGDGAAPSAAHGPHAMRVLLARAEGHQPPTLGTHLGLPGGRQETVKPADPCSGAHSPSTEVTLPLRMWKSRELLGIHSQSMSKALERDREDQWDNKGHTHPQTGRAWEISARKESNSPLRFASICL